MSRIKVKNFGPIKKGFQDNDGWLDIKKVTIFIGDQASGKSTVAKLISTMTWLEKAIYKEDISIKDLNKKYFIHRNLMYHRIHSYLSANTEIYYQGEVASFSFKNGEFKFSYLKINKKYPVPKIMYVPAERNFLTTIEEVEDVKGMPQPLYTFSEEFNNARRNLKAKIPLPISRLKYFFNIESNTSQILGENYIIDLLHASSGLQSFVPLYLVTRYLATSVEDPEDPSKMPISLNQQMRLVRQLDDAYKDKKLTTKERSEIIKLIFSKYKYDCFINIIEEPEQNLFPTSQWEMIKSLLNYNNMNIGNKLIITSHSPYLINYLTVAVKANMLESKIKKGQLKNKINKLVPYNSTIKPNDLSIYELNAQGEIFLLGTVNKLPSDENYLNRALEDANNMFGQLLEIQQEA